MYYCSSKPCPVRIYLLNGQYYKELNVEHDHESDPIRVAVRAVELDACQMMRANPCRMTRDVTVDALSKVPQLISRHVKRENLDCCLRRIKKVSTSR